MMVMMMAMIKAFAESHEATVAPDGRGGRLVKSQAAFNYVFNLSFGSIAPCYRTHRWVKVCCVIALVISPPLLCISRTWQTRNEKQSEGRQWRKENRNPAQRVIVYWAADQWVQTQPEEESESGEKKDRERKESERQRHFWPLIVALERGREAERRKWDVVTNVCTALDGRTE